LELRQHERARHWVGSNAKNELWLRAMALDYI